MSCAPERPCYNWLVAILTIYSRAVSLAIERNRLTLPATPGRTLLCSKGADMTKHAANTTEAVPQLKPIPLMNQTARLTTTLRRCRSVTRKRTQKSVSREH